MTSIIGAIRGIGRKLTKPSSEWWYKLSVFNHAKQTIDRINEKLETSKPLDKFDLIEVHSLENVFTKYHVDRKTYLETKVQDTTLTEAQRTETENKIAEVNNLIQKSLELVEVVKKNYGDNYYKDALAQLSPSGSAGNTGAGTSGADLAVILTAFSGGKRKRSNKSKKLRGGRLRSRGRSGRSARKSRSKRHAR